MLGALDLLVYGLQSWPPSTALLGVARSQDTRVDETNTIPGSSHRV